MKRSHLSAAIAMACYVSMGMAMAQDATTSTTTDQTKPRANASNTSNTTLLNQTQRDAKQMEAVTVQGQSLSLGGGLMSVQTAPKAVSTITRDAIEKASPGSNFTQLIGSIPGVNAATDDATGLANGHYSMRGYDSSDIGMTVNGAPITDTGSYSVYATEYGDSENMGDITVLQGIPDIDMPDAGASGGHIGWATIDPSHQGSVDITQSFGNDDYKRTFVRLQTGDLGPIRSWISFSDNSANMWRGAGDLNVKKIDAKSVWTIDDNNSISASLQYSRQNNYSYDGLSKAQAQQNYFYNYNTQWIPLNGLTGTALKTAATTDESFYGVHTNPYTSYMFSMDGEFSLGGSTKLSVIPYWWYGNGGGGSGSIAQESTSAVNKYLYAQQDLNGDGKLTNGNYGTVYGYSAATTWRPGVLAKANTDLGMDDSLEYGFWYERSRKTQNESFGLVNPETGAPEDFWGNSQYVTYANGSIQRLYQEYTTTEQKKFFVTDNWSPNDYWTFTAGVSELYANRQGSAEEYPGASTYYGNTFNNSWHKFLPMAGVKFQLDDHNQFYVGTGKTMRVPINTSAIYAALDHSVLSAKPEMSWNTDLGWRFYGDSVSASVDLYNSNYFNKQESGYDPVTNLSVYTTISHMEMRGLNSEASWNFAPNFSLYGSYTYTQAKIQGTIDGGPYDSYTGKGPGIYDTVGKTMPDTPRNMGNISVSYDNKTFWASLNARATSSLWGDYMNTQSVGGFTTFNFSAGWRFHDIGWLTSPYIKFNVSNLADRHALSYVSSAVPLATAALAKPLNLYASTAYYGLLEPRTYMMTFGVSIK